MAIRFRGMLKDFSQLEEGNLPENAHILDEGGTLDEVLADAMRQTAPIFVVMALLTVVRFIKGLNWAADTSLGQVTLYIVAASVLYMVLIVVHELIHAAFYPLKTTVDIWFYGAQAALIYTTARVSKLRFIVLSLAPAILLGFVPFVLWLLYAPLVSVPASIAWMLLAWTMVFGGIGDFYNVRNVVRQVQKNALVFNYGIHTYWIEK